MNARKGKIARLPASVREDLNRRLLDGQRGSQILPWINGLPDVQQILAHEFEGVAVSDQNLSEWRHGGFAEWLGRREQIEQTREMARWSVKLARASGGNLTEGAAAILSGQILEVLEGMTQLKTGGTVQTAEQMAALAEAVKDLTDSLSSLRRGDHDREKLNLDRKRLDQGGETLALAREKFQRETCELFLRWSEDRRALDVTQSAGDNAGKIEALGKLMFGDDWRK